MSIIWYINIALPFKTHGKFTKHLWFFLALLAIASVPLYLRVNHATMYTVPSNIARMYIHRIVLPPCKRPDQQIKIIFTSNKVERWWRISIIPLSNLPVSLGLCWGNCVTIVSLDLSLHYLPIERLPTTPPAAIIYNGIAEFIYMHRIEIAIENGTYLTSSLPLLFHPIDATGFDRICLTTSVSIKKHSEYLRIRRHFSRCRRPVVIGPQFCSFGRYDTRFIVIWHGIKLAWHSVNESEINPIRSYSQLKSDFVHRHRRYACCKCNK